MSANNEKQARKLADDRMKARVKAIAPSLPRNYKKIVVAHYPQFNTVDGGDLIANVKAGRTAHSGLTAIFEDIAQGRLTLTGEPVA